MKHEEPKVNLIAAYKAGLAYAMDRLDVVNYDQLRKMAEDIIEMIQYLEENNS